MIMILTGKALEDFTKWNGDRQFDMMLPFEYPIYLNAIIIEWLDSIGLKIVIYPTIFIDVWSCDIFGYTECQFENITSRQEATEKAIETANKIYNETKS